MESLFHLSIAVDDLDRARAFYIDMLVSRTRNSRDRISGSKGHYLFESSVIQLPKFGTVNVPNFGTITLGCTVGREAPGRIDINFFGHHIVAHLAPDEADRGHGAIESDGDTAPLRHFGVILPLDGWKQMERRLTSRDVDFTLAPRLSFAGKPAEQHIMMLPDGCGNTVEFKSQPRERVFATDAP